MIGNSKINKKISAIIAVFLVVLGTWRLPFFYNRLFLDILFQIICSLTIGCLIFFYIDRWIGLFLWLSFLSHISFNAVTFSTSFSSEAYIHVLYGIFWYSIIFIFCKKDKKILLDTIGLIGIFSFISIFCYRIGIPILPGQTNGNEYSALFALCLPAMVRKKWYKFIPLILIGLFLSKAWIGIVAIIISYLVLIIIKFEFNFIGIISLMIIFLECFLYYKFIDHPSITVRFATLKFCLTSFLKRPFLGYGLGSFRQNAIWNMTLRHIDSNGKLWWQTANNEFAQGLYELGIGFFLIITGYLISTFRKIKNKENSMFVFLIIILTSCFTYIFHNSLNAIITITWLAILKEDIRGDNT